MARGGEDEGELLSRIAFPHRSGAGSLIVVSAHAHAQYCTYLICQLISICSSVAIDVMFVFNYLHVNK